MLIFGSGAPYYRENYSSKSGLTNEDPGDMTPRCLVETIHQQHHRLRYWDNKCWYPVTRGAGVDILIFNVPDACLHIYQPQPVTLLLCKYTDNSGHWWCISGDIGPGPKLWETSFLHFVNIQLQPSLSSVSYISIITCVPGWSWLFIGSSRSANESTAPEMSTNQIVSGSGAAAAERDQN